MNYRKNRGKNTCSIEGCINKFRCSGYCNSHYQRLLKRGTTETAPMHGMINTPEYTAWKHMRDRCYNPKCPNYKHYGGRGITVYEPWRKSFQFFYDYVGNRPSKDFSLDRIDNDGNYEPGNIRWATRTQQNYNKRQLRRKIAPETGVFPSSNGKRFIAHISVDRKYYSLGTYDTIHEAKHVHDDVKEQILNYD